MATRNAIAVMMLNARNRMLDSVEALEGSDARKAIEATQFESRDIEYRLARQMEEVAGVLERQVASIRSSAETDLDRLDGIGPDLAGELRAAGFPTVSDLDAASDADLLAVDGVGATKLKALRKELDSLGADPPVVEQQEGGDDGEPDGGAA